jgi:hypothetical protein
MVTEGGATNQLPATTRGVMPHAADPEVAERLWPLSEQLLQKRPA